MDCSWLLTLKPILNGFVVVDGIGSRVDSNDKGGGRVHRNDIVFEIPRLLSGSEKDSIIFNRRFLKIEPH